MTSLTKLKDEARRHEQQEEWDRAIQLYLRVLRGAEEGETEVELPLYNRVGDLYLRLGKPADAVEFYEQAADRYAESGLYNNAIALCNKALRYAPTKLVLVRKLGRFCALQGFATDARRWFLTYAERMFAQGAPEDALSALEDFATISDDPEIRELLARHLHAHGRPEEALTEFRRAYGMRLVTGDGAGADALKTEVLRLYPDEVDLTPEPLEPLASGETVAHEVEAVHLPQLAESVQHVDRPLPGLVRTDAAVTEPGSFRPAGEPGGLVRGEHERPTVEALPGLESTQVGEGETPPPSAEALPGFESTAISYDQDIESETVEEEEEEEEEGAPSLEELRAAYDLPEHVEEDEYSADDMTPLPLLDVPAADGARAADDLYNVSTIEIRPTTEDLEPLGTAPSAGSDYIDLVSFIDPDEGRITDTRFVIEEKEPTGDEDRDFAELLSQFKAKLHEAVDPDDAASHYDLGLAFKEMGLVDEAIGEFQRAMRAGEQRLKVLEELGQCFITKGQHNIAVRMLQTAVGLQHQDDLELIGVFYHLGRAYEALGRANDARDAYEHVMGLDINFEDVAERIVRL
jgi:tetratricopeptide (TPR) repeat protein